MTLEDARKAAVDAVQQLSVDVKIPTKLTDVGAKAEDIDALAEAAMADVCTGGNPREAKLEEVKELYRSLM